MSDISHLTDSVVSQEYSIFLAVILSYLQTQSGKESTQSVVEVTGYTDTLRGLTLQFCLQQCLSLAQLDASPVEEEEEDKEHQQDGDKNPAIEVVLLLLRQLGDGGLFLLCLVDDLHL